VSPIELLSRLRDLHVQVIADGERLRVRAPEGALTPELQAALAAHKAAILALLKGSSAVAAAPAPRAAAAGDALPLSFAQERFWFLEHLEQGTSAHHLVFAIRFEGALDERAVRGALQHLVDRHAALRTSFVDDGGRPRQVIAVHAAADVRLVDLQQHPAAERFTEAVRVAQAASREPFDLGRAPLMRNLLLRISPLDHVLAFVFHHIVSDGWSTGIVMRDFAEAYRAAQSGTAATLPPLPVGYADFALRQREALASGALAAQTDYWKKQLTGLSTLELPTDRPRPAVLTVRGAEYRFTLGKALSESLVRLSHREGVTLFMTALAGFQALLHRYSQQDEFAVGTAIAGRSAAEFDDVVGPFINTLVLRSNLEGNPSFRELLRRVRVTALDAYANQDLPFEKLVDELQPDRDLSRNALYQVIFALQNLPVPDVRLEGLTLSVVPLERVTAALDLDWLLYPTPEGLQGTIRYSSDLFDAATVARMARHYEHLLESAVAAPQQRIADLSMLDDRERTLVTSEWNQTARPYPDRAGLAELFEAQVQRRPAAVAIADDVQTLTYAELNERANRLAHFLIGCGIGPDALVGVFHERCVDAIVALVAIMKAGGAYLPLDPAYPEERLALMLDDARPGVLLTRRALAERLPRFHGRVVCLDELPDRLRGESAANPALRSSPEHLAYVTYTSGSTGVPKGVEVRQRGVTRLLFGVDYVQIAEDDGFLQLASISFDASTFEVWGALLHGARLALLEEAVPTPDQLGEVLARHRVTILWLTASFFNAIVDVNPDVLSGVRQLLIGGEALSVAHVRRAQAALPGTQIINGYGPTESTTFTCCYRIPALPDDGVTSISIGRPIGNTTVRVLDAAGRACAVGVPGELYIGGDGLARGYLHHPALTAERFVPDPSGAPGARLYRTGDIVRYAPDGLIQFLGRNDEQVKIRGFRVEPGEVEQVLRQHPDVAEAAVIVQKQSPTSRRLVAYVAPKRGAGAADFLDEVKQFAQGQLPAYMVPAAFVVIPALPLTANGKLDRRALPDPEPVRRGDTAGGAPRNAVEAALAEVWVRVLRVERVGIDEDFFALGGDSILSLQVVAGVRQHGLKVTPRQIFEHPTVSALARVAQVLEPARPDAAAARAAIATGEVPLTPIQHWFFEQAPARPEHFNHAVLLRLTQPIDRARLADALAHVIDRHDALRLRFARTADGGWRQWYAESNTAPMVSAFDLSAQPAAEQAAAIERHGAALQASFDLSSGPTVAMATFELGAGGSRVLFVVHHLAIDAVSWGVLLGDLQTAYQQLTRHEAVNLGETTAAFGAWARLLRAHAERIAPETSFWAALADAPLPSWPLDEPGGENVAASERTIAASLSADDTHALLQEIPRKYGMRIHEILLVALAGTFAEWTKHPAVLVDVEGHGRETLEDEDVDLTRTVGWFTTIHPVLLDLTRTTTIDERLKRVKEQLRRVPNHGLGYGVLRHLAADPGVRRRLADVPAPDVSFNYLGQVDGTFARGLFAPAVEPAGPATDPRNPRAHVFEVSARVLGGQLHVAWHYSAALHSAATAERLTRRFLDLVREIVAHCRSTQAAAALTPSDFPEANVSQDELDRLLASIGEIESQS
jgi:amino acid adenylation domain-containing protein/non-ribosomal peptide synthase protein (TIGR01720 family)